MTKATAIETALKLDEVSKHAQGKEPTRCHFKRRGPHIVVTVDFDEKKDGSNEHDDDVDDEDDIAYVKK